MIGQAIMNTLAFIAVSPLCLQTNMYITEHNQTAVFGGYTMYAEIRDPLNTIFKIFHCLFILY